MNVLVDTSVWSLAFRRKEQSQNDPHVADLQRLIQEMRVLIIGPIRQEILSGIRSSEQYERLRKRLAVFPDLPIKQADYERAAELFNICRGRGIQGSNTDFLICAVAESNGVAIFTTDKDFFNYQQHSLITLHEIHS